MDTDRTLPQSGEDLRRAQERSVQRLRPPTDVPGYEPERFLGEGAYGEVWVALDRNTGRRVAIKFYAHRGGLDWSLLHREVEKLAFLFADRYVVQLVDVGWDADPPYYVMEYIEQGSLEDRLRQGPLAVAEAVELFREVAIGLVHAHGKGVLHCDLKPANVLVDQDFKPRLADFGQSRLSHEQSPALGTLFYMAPEQANLNAVPDARWDVYALGAVLYAMLTGQPPYRSEKLVAEIESARNLESRLTAYQHALTTASRPAMHRQVPGIDRPLAEIIDRCLAIDPEKRFPNVQAVLGALDARASNRARRPLLVLGILGPLLLLSVMLVFGFNVVNTAVQDSGEALTRQALESNRFTARFVAETVARQIDRRWAILEQEAGDSHFLEVLARSPEIPSVEPAETAAERLRQWRKSPEREALQDWLEKLYAKYNVGDNVTASWFVTDAQGHQLARAPLINLDLLGQSFAHRDYFHGQGFDMEIRPGEPPPPPVEQVHRSVVFKSSSTSNRVVAFSTPVWSGPEGLPERRIVGVLAMTVELGKFAELRPDGAVQDQVAVLVDLVQDGDKQRRGSILEHPLFTELLRKHRSNPAYQLPLLHVDAERLALLDRVPRFTLPPNIDGPTDDPSTIADYRDPVAGQEDGTEYAGRWLTACKRVIIDGRPSHVQDSGWIVLVQLRYSAATAPVQQLGDSLMRKGMVAFCAVIAVVTALWGFVVVALTESSRSAFVATLRRSIGLSTSSSLATPTSPRGYVGKTDHSRAKKPTET